MKMVGGAGIKETIWICCGVWNSGHNVITENHLGQLLGVLHRGRWWLFNLQSKWREINCWRSWKGGRRNSVLSRLSLRWWVAIKLKCQVTSCSFQREQSRRQKVDTRYRPEGWWHDSNEIDMESCRKHFNQPPKDFKTKKKKENENQSKNIRRVSKIKSN